MHRRTPIQKSRSYSSAALSIAVFANKGKRRRRTNKLGAGGLRFSSQPWSGSFADTTASVALFGETP
jgi:hypothetical protein